MPIIAKADPEVGVGPRGFHSQYLKGLNEEETKEFAKLCEHSLTHNDWFTTRFQGSIVTAIAKNAQRETRPACAKDRDAAAALQGAQKLFTNATRLSCEHETSVGVKGGTQLCAWGFKCCMEEARRNERPITILTEDRINAHNTFFRHKTIEEMQFLAQTNPEIEKMLAVSQPILSSKNPIYFRTRSSPSGLSHLTNCCEGGEQGNAMTNLHYPLTFQSVIRQANARFENTIVKSYQDDVFLMASAEDMFGQDKVREFVNSELAVRGSILHPNKSHAYGSNQAERDLIPDDIDQPFFVMFDQIGSPYKTYGIEILGVPIGDPEYVQEWIRRKGDAIVDKIRLISQGVQAIDPHCGTTVTRLSLQEQACFVMQTNLPSQTAGFARRVDEAAREAFAINHGTDLLAHAEDIQDPQFITDRAKLRTNQGGAGIRSQLDRDHFLSTLCLVLPQMIRSDDNQFTSLFPNLEDLLGQGSFDKDRTDSRWTHFATSDNIIAHEFIEAYQRAKATRDQLLTLATNVEPIGEPTSTTPQSTHSGLK